MKSLIKSIRHAFRGIMLTSKEEHNFQFQLIIALFLIIMMAISDFSAIEITIIIFTITLVLMSEILNTAIENLLDKLHPNHDKTVGKIKDMSAGFVLIASIGSLIIGIIISVSHFL